ncbi:hypothetical protein [Alteromonas sp.]|uniref:hypothetical protein n=1 Tax=Alteromonas sp. TaxID=232 RepID=UPI00257E612E|nr:hypothetical protein [Alteromonas sp.]
MPRCLYTVVGAIGNLTNGEIQAGYGYAIIYVAIAITACFAVSGYMKYQSNSVRSDLVAVEAHTWFVVGVLSASVL